MSDFLHAQFATQLAERFALEVNLQLPGDGVSAIFGASGSGKTTLLRCIAGLHRAERGHLSVGGVVWQNQQIFLPTHQRPLGYVFQEANLFSHLTVQGNLHYAMKRATTKPTAAEYEHTLDQFNLRKLLHQFPAQLSGGEKQRVAIARALLINPSLLLMDEPLASLDAQHKHEILPFLEQLKSELRMPMLYVSHAVDEVTRLADYLVILAAGKVVASGSMTELLAQPDLPIQLGEEAGAVLKGEIIERDNQWHLVKVKFNSGEFWVRDSGASLGSPVRMRILARDVSLAHARHSDTSIVNIVQATVSQIHTESDAMALVQLALGDAKILARVTRRSIADLNLQAGQTVWAQIKSVAIVR